MKPPDWKKELEAEARKLINRFEKYASRLAGERHRRARRSTAPAEPLVTRRSLYWNAADGFNPYLVRARAARIAHAIEHKLRIGTYEPFNPIVYKIPKPHGGSRTLSIFQIADNAVSKQIFRILLDKNRPLLSSRAYAYRDDVSVHDALQFIGGDLRGESRVFVAEYDFSAYFDNIEHEHLWRILRDRRFLVTSREQHILAGFLAALPQKLESYLPQSCDRRPKGIPQGTSISLFLANVAAWDLDRALERLGVSFARYADDTLVWSRDYAQICRAADVIHETADRIGAPLNFKKSGGIRLLTQHSAPAEMNSVHYVEFLSHSISSSVVSVKGHVIRTFQQHILKLLYFHLIREPRRGTQNPDRLTTIDRDYVAFVWQLRRYIYGPITEKRLRRMRRRGPPFRRFGGIMAFFPLVNDDAQLKDLDGWICRHTHLALRRRAKLLSNCISSLPSPHGLPLNEIRTLKHVSQTTRETVDLRLPSVLRISQLIRAAADRFGAARIGRAPSFDYRRQRS
jgi:hypothetical protein